MKLVVTSKSPPSVSVAKIQIVIGVSSGVVVETVSPAVITGGLFTNGLTVTNYVSFTHSAGMGVPASQTV